MEFLSITWIDDACQSFLNDSQNNIKEGTNFDFGLTALMKLNLYLVQWDF